jgi:uncharacterized membrane-anchored protein YitT (DUF2179 family)
MPSPVKTKGWARHAKDGVFILLGSLCFGLCLNLFLIDNEIVAGGFSGVGTVLYYLYRFPVGLSVFLMNVPLVLYSFTKIGKKFVLKTLIATFLTSAAIDLLAPLPLFTGDKRVASRSGGVVPGGAGGPLYLAEARSGGSDLLAWILQKVSGGRFAVGQILMAIDFIVVLIAAAAFRSVESALYAAITIFINGKVVDALIAGFNYAKAAYIVTERAQEVSKGILAEIGRGVTALEATGMYTESPKKVLFCVVKKQELVHLKEVIRRTDPEAFVILTQATEVLGEGFLSRGPL